MRIRRYGAALAAITLAMGVGLAACGSDDDDHDTFIAYTVEPQNPFISGNTTETGGGRVMDTIMTGLVLYGTETGEPQNAIAESIETDDAQNYTITLNEGWKFHDGTDVTAESFVKAWNYNAYTPNGMANGSFLFNIQGYDEVHPPEDEDGNAPEPTATEMSGLEVVSETEFTVELKAPFSVFPTMLGYRGFDPYPESFYDDPEGYGKDPIGTGPFKVKDVKNNGVELEKFDDYQGKAKAQVDKFTWRYYTNDLTAYRDIQNGKLDFMEQIPLSRLGTFEDDFGSRSSNKDVAVIQTIDFPMYEAKYQDPNLRKAVSMAIDRQSISDNIFDGGTSPADSLVSPSIPGYEEGACGDLCEYKPDEAKALWQQVEWSGDMEIWYNSDGGHKDWIEAVCASIQRTLEINCTAQATERFADLRTQARAQTFTQLWRAGWQADYPSIENYLNPLFRTGGSSNTQGYSDPAVDAQLDVADSTTDQQQRYAEYRKAEDMILDAMPAIPAFFPKRQSVWSENVETDGEIVDWKGALDPTKVKLK